MNNELSDKAATPLAAAPQFPGYEQRAHMVQFYSEDDVLLDEVSRFIGTALGAGDAAIAIAIPAHREGLAQRLSQRGLDISRIASEGRFVALDAAGTLSKITTDGFPDRSRFAELIGDQIVSARKRTERERPVAIFGEMVALLWAEGRSTAVLQLEGLWNELAKTHSFSLRCAYPIGSFYREEHGEPFLKICGQHSVVIPGENYTLLTGDEQRLRSIAYLQQRSEALEAEISLRESETRFHLLVEAVQDYAIFMLDTEGRVMTWNVGAERIKGYKASEIIGRHFSCFYPEEDVISDKPQLGLEIAAREGRFETEGWRLRKDGSKFWANVIITALKNNAGGLFGFTKVTRDFTEKMLADKALRDSQLQLQESEKSLRDLSLHLLRTQDEERRRIGRELHDSVGQNLSFMKMKLDSMKSLTGDGKIDDIQQHLAEFGRIVEDAVTEVRTISYLLYPPMLEELGLKSAISWYVDGFTKRSGIQTRLDVSCDLGRLPRDAEMAMFRILQESLTNIHRHSGSRTATVRLLLREARLILEITDQGKGIPSANLEESGEDWTGALGVGLRGMHERMRQLGGKLELQSTSTGTTIVAEVPIETPASADAASA
jgi:PAS domain S-box-containing protein